MLPAAHLLPCEVLSEDEGAITLATFEELLPLRETGPGYLVFWPRPELPESLEDLDWPALLTAPFDRNTLLIPRSSVLRSLTPEGQLAAFAIGDPFDLAPMRHEVLWSDGERITLRLESPARLADLLGAEPPRPPEMLLTLVDYELTAPQAAEHFGERAQWIGTDRARYTCWALARFPHWMEATPTPLPHVAPEESLAAVEAFLVADAAPLEAARVAGWRWRGVLWTNPESGAPEDGLIYAALEPGEGEGVECTTLHWYSAGQALTSLLPIPMRFARSEPHPTRWMDNRPFP